MDAGFSRRGPLAFPITPFHMDGSLDRSGFRDHIRWLLDFEPAALFVACGTGEFPSLGPGEVGKLVSAAVQIAGSEVPVYAGVGHGFGLAPIFEQAARDAGATGLLAFPPYLVNGEQEGLFEYYRHIAAVACLPMIAYQRGSAVFEPELIDRLAEIPWLVGIKDGLGDIERMQRLVGAGRDRFTYFNGMPTAETFQPAYAAIGVHHYSSAVFNFAPEISWAFYSAITEGDRDMLQRLLDAFYIPLTNLRGKVRGYAVALMKAGVALRRRPLGGVRAPLLDVTPEHIAALREILEHGLAALRA